MTNILQIVADSSTIEEIFMLGLLSFLVSMVLTPLYTSAAFSGKWWKKPRTTAMTGETATVYKKLHAAKHARNIPTMAGIIFVMSTILVTLSGNLSRSETWLPLAAMAGAGVVGLFDDIINIRSLNGGIAGMRAKVKSLFLLGISFVGGWWFFAKLGVIAVHVPFIGTWHLGWLIVPLFMLVIFATANAVNITDGLDGLAGGLAVSAFSAYALIALAEKKYGFLGFFFSFLCALLTYYSVFFFLRRFFFWRA